MQISDMKITEIQNKLKQWWEHGEQENPCILIKVGKDSSPDIPCTNDLFKHWNDVDFIVEREIKRINNTNYYGVAVPYHYVDYGSSAMTGVLGARMEFVDKRTIWAYPIYNSIEEMCDEQLNPGNSCYETILNITRKSAALSKNHHYVTPFALSGITDNIAGLYGSENLLIDMIDKPVEVKKAMEHVKRIWIEMFNEINELIETGGNYGSVGWAGIWAPGRTFPLQEDFSYMISSAMYDEFCLPHVADIISSMEYPMYHLDGIGAIRHLDSLLGIRELKAIQWVPGAGHEEIKQWYDLIRHILSKGKSVQVYATVEEIDDLIKNTGTIGMLITCTNASDSDAEKLMEKYGGNLTE